MKHVLFSFLLLLACINVNASNPIITEVSQENDVDEKKHSETLLLVTIEFQEELLSILSNGTLEDAGITITDCSGNIRYTELTTIVVDNPHFILLSDLENGMYTIEISGLGYHFSSNFIIT